MFPWFWFHWAPQLHFPLSGAVTQDIISGIRPAAGDAGIERAVFDVASYGRQLGWLTEVLLGEQSDATPERVARGQASLRRLQALDAEIAVIKDGERRARHAAAATALDALAQHDPEALASLLARHAAALPPPAAVSVVPPVAVTAAVPAKRASAPRSRR